MPNQTYPSGTGYPEIDAGVKDAGFSGTDFSSTGVRERVSNMTQHARECATEFGQQTADSIDRNLDTAAEKLHTTAESLRAKAGPATDRVSQLASTAAEKLDATAQYFRDHHTRDLVSGVEQTLRRNPGASLVAALAVGFLLGSAMKKSRS